MPHIQNKKRIRIHLSSMSNDIKAGISRFAYDAEWVLQWSDGESMPNPLLPCDGWIIEQGSTNYKRVIQMASGTDVPVVRLGDSEQSPRSAAFISGVRMSEVTLDYRSAGRVAASWFLDSGHTDFMFVCIGMRGHKRLWEGFQSTLNKAGHNPRIVRLGTDTPTSANVLSVDDLAKLLRDTTPPLAILARCDHTAALVLEACERINTPVPEEISVMGCGNDKTVCRHTAPQLTSIETDKETLGYVSAELLQRMIDQPSIQNRQVNMNARGIAKRSSTTDMAIRHLEAAKAFTFIEQHYQEPNLKIGDIAHASQISKPGLNKAFKKHLGRSASEELRRRRMSHARELLKSTNNRVYEIAEESGFKNEKHMRDTFIRETGMRPGEFRHCDEDNDYIDV